MFKKISSTKTNLQRTGFSLVELLCVIAIIGVLISFLFPAIQHVREAARRTACKNKLHQLALACCSYESSHQVFPPGTLGFNEPCNITSEEMIQSVFDQPSHRFYWKNQQHTSWLVQILPWIEENSLDQSIPKICRDVNRSYKDYRLSHPGAPQWLDEIPEVQEAAGTKVPSFLCPSDSIESVSPFATIYDFPTAVGSQAVYISPNDTDILHGKPITDFSFETLAPTNYAGCTGAYSGGDLRGVNRRVAKSMSPYRGIFRSRRSATLAGVTDGTTQTVLIGESIGMVDLEERATPLSWFFSGLCRGRGNLDWDTGKSIAVPGLLLFGDRYVAWPVGFGSMHPSVCNFAFADGSIRSIDRGIDFEVFKALTGCADGRPVE